MKFARILAAIASKYWAMQPDKLYALVEIMRNRLESGKLSEQEIVAKIGSGQEKQIAKQQGDVLVLPLQGVITNRAALVSDVSSPPGTSAEAFSNQFRTALNDPAIKAIVLDVNSPGGTVNGVDELASEVFAARGVKPVIAQVNSMAASAAYWIASAAEEMVVNPTGEVGSIGVYTLHEDVSQMLEAAGVKETFISAGKYKVEGNPFEPLGDEAKAAIQDDVNAYYDMFVRAVSRNRKASLSAVRGGFGEGRMVRADKAVAEGMADRIGTMRETLGRLGVNTDAPPAAKVKTSGRKSSLLMRELELLEK